MRLGALMAKRRFEANRGHLKGDRKSAYVPKADIQLCE
jgi:hypothetical protein